MVVLGLRFCTRAFSSCGKRGPLFIVVRGPLTIAASPITEHRLQTHRLSNCGSRAQLLRGMWGLPRPGLEPVSPALAGRFSTTAPPGKPFLNIFIGVQLIYNVVLVSGVPQSESVIHILYIYPLFFKILLPYRPLQSIQQSSMCYIVGSYQLSILYLVLVYVNPSLPVYPSPHLVPW